VDVDLPAEDDPRRLDVRAWFADHPSPSPRALVDAGFVVPHWPRPYGLDADPELQLIIEDEMRRAGVSKPLNPIGIGHCGPILVALANDEQKQRYIVPMLTGEELWCQLFSEPGAGSDAAGIRTRATRTEQGWRINGQKVWTSGAREASFGLATVRTNPDAPKHQGITTMVIDMHAPGVTVRPLKMPSGNSDFNEIFFDDVFVPDEDVVGPVDGGWTVARATLGNESVSIGGGDGGMTMPARAFIAPLDAHPERLAGGAGRVGRHIARTQALAVLNQRSAYRAVAGGQPGPEGNIAKLLLSELGHETAAIMAELAGPDGAFLEGAGAMAASLVLMNRAMSIAGGTSEIKRNQIAERILGLPRDPLINN
jgi:alkylation response protein AidB-like acyl-CoA dehydrogenase